LHEAGVLELVEGRRDARAGLAEPAGEGARGAGTPVEQVLEDRGAGGAHPERVRGGLAVGDRRGDHLAQPRGQPVRALRRLSLLR
jgi:hypothetical protein